VFVEVGAHAVPRLVQAQAEVLAVVLLGRRRALPGLLAQREVHVFDGGQGGVAAFVGAHVRPRRRHALVYLVAPTNKTKNATRKKNTEMS
jgi:hypothetical protein